MPRRALPMSAAKSSAACSDGDGRCRASANIRSKSRRACRWRSPAGMLTAKGKLGELKLQADRPCRGHGRGQQGRGEAAHRASAQARMMWGTTRALVANMVKGVSDRLREVDGDHRHRLSRRGAGQEPGDEPRATRIRRGLSDPGRASRSPASGRRRSRSKAWTSAWSVRSPPRSARSVRPSPTRARACATRRDRSGARKARRSNERA